MKRVLITAAALSLVAAGALSASASTPATSRGEARVCAAPAAGHAACHAHVVTNASTGRPLATSTWSGGYQPSDLTSVYKPGSSVGVVAVVDAYANPNAASDLSTYRAQFGLGPANLTQINQSGGDIGSVSGNSGWGQEEMLDLEMVSAMCPACPILYVGANSASFNDLAAAVTTAASYTVNGQKATAISNSYGGNEFSSEASLSGPYNLQHVAVTVSSGDSGYGAEFPATAQDVIAVGGTSLKVSNGARTSETAWSGAGSGCSAYITRPVWQPSGTACSRRVESDISAVADPYTGVAVYDSYGSTNNNNWYVFGGTSVAAPLVGTIYATYGVPVGSHGYAVENAWSTAGRAGLYDVTSGSNGRCTTKRSTTGAYLCTAGSGYDGPTGNGTPNGASAAF